VKLILVFSNWSPIKYVINLYYNVHVDIRDIRNELFRIVTNFFQVI